MRIDENVDPKKWEEFVEKNQSYNFLQSYWWGQVLRNEKKEILYYEFKDNNKILGVVLVEKKKMARGGLFYLESLWGPVWLKKVPGQIVSEALRCFYSFVAKKNKAIFWRLSPPAVALISPRYIESDCYLESGFLEPTAAWDFLPTLARTRPPRRTLLLNIEPEEEKILSQMKPKTRYNIKLAAKKGVKIKWSRSLKDLRTFYKLHKITAKRGGFNSHGFDHYLRILKTPHLSPKNKVELITASYKGKAISSNIVLFFNESVFYLHGASGNTDRNLMSTYLLHFETIKKAKKEGYKNYDFWGIDKEKWPGVTKFKEGFGGIKKDYPPIYEIPLMNYPYKLYRLYRKVTH